MHLNADSLHYIDMARTWIADRTIATWHLTLNAERVPAVEMLWPPVYGILLAGPLALGLSPNAATWAVAVASHAALLWLLTAVARRIEWGLLLGLLLIHLTFWHGIAFRAFSEMPFIAFTFGALVAMALALQGGAPPSRRSRAVWLALAAGVLAAAAALTRHIGLLLIPALGLMALAGPIRARGNALRTRATALASMIAGAGIPLGLWALRHASLGSRFLGPHRPASHRDLSEVLLRFAQSAYSDVGMLLLVFAAIAVGYHLLERDERAGWHAFALCLAGGALTYAALHEVGTIASHTVYRMDNPPEGRHFFPGYAALLLAACAFISLMRPPGGVLRRRWPIVALLALPILAGPLVAGTMAHDLTPARTVVEEWIAAHTGPDDLVIGWRVWPVRFHTGRPVLQSGMVTEPPIHDGAAVARFLSRFGAHFTGAWLLIPAGRNDSEQALASYRDAGLKPQKVAELDVTGVRQYQGAGTIEVYRLNGRQR